MTSQNPELASILRTLSQFAPPKAPPSQLAPPQASAPPPNQQNNSRPLSRTSGDARGGGGGGRTQAPPPTLDPRRRSNTPSTDPSRITTWPPALKYVMNTVSQNQAATSKIKQLIKQQHDHERQWWVGREALVAKQNGRDESKKRADDLLRSLGGITAPTLAINGGAAAAVAQDKAELERYDKKIYVALTRMVADMDRDLRAMGIPFYAIKHELVILDEGKNVKSNENRIDKGELRELQKRMLQLLEDLFKE